MSVRVCPICDIAECKKHAPKKALPMTDITVPPEALEAAVVAFKRAFMAGQKDAMEAAITSCLEAWQGAVIRPPFLPNHLILPLPTEKTNAEA